ncbi:MAG: hypothetical protein KatS3mg035_0039 [Bacteroidia bacterium]|nr:MAG: hypothetical protein KatS3mg035_0039 [Bacteroidia bacterium]
MLIDNILVYEQVKLPKKIKKIYTMQIHCTRVL